MKSDALQVGLGVGKFEQALDGEIQHVVVGVEPSATQQGQQAEHLTDVQVLAFLQVKHQYQLAGQQRQGNSHFIVLNSLLTSAIITSQSQTNP